MLGESHKVHGVVVGTVIDVLDPLMLGRVQVQLPSLDSADLSPWARVATPMAGAALGRLLHAATRRRGAGRVRARRRQRRRTSSAPCGTR